MIRIGVTGYAQNALGDVVFVELPSAVASVDLSGTVPEIESTKTVSGLFAPATGSIVESNDSLMHLNRSTMILTATVGSARST